LDDLDCQRAGGTGGEADGALRRDVEVNLNGIYGHARKAAEIALRQHREIQATAPPPVDPYTFDQILADDWCPQPPGGAM
jgi:hypothetical protein